MDNILSENGVITGNIYDKYTSKNPIVRKLMNGFYNSFFSLLNMTEAKDIHEIGCGEGMLSLYMAEKGFNVRGSDFSIKIIDKAKRNAQERGMNISFVVKSIYDIDHSADSSDIIVCSEVLEHLEFPEDALRKLSLLNCNYLVLSVPREPFWCLMNIARFKYLRNFGNTPGHINHWSKGRFVTLIKKYFNVEKVLSPLPWTIIMCKRKNENCL